MKLGSNDPRFLKLKEESSSFGEVNDCSIKAITLATGKPYSEVLALSYRFGRKKGKGTYIETSKKILDALGFEVIILEEYIWKRIGKTFLTFARNNYIKSSNLIIYSSTHMAAIVDGDLIDWAIEKRKRIQSVWKIQKKEEE